MAPGPSGGVPFIVKGTKPGKGRPAAEEICPRRRSTSPRLIALYAATLTPISDWQCGPSFLKSLFGKPSVISAWKHFPLISSQAFRRPRKSGCGGGQSVGADERLEGSA